jgi:hypothetical protein
MSAADAIKDNIDAIAREAVNLFHEVLILIVNWDTAQVRNGERPAR